MRAPRRLSGAGEWPSKKSLHGPKQGRSRHCFAGRLWTRAIATSAPRVRRRPGLSGWLCRGRPGGYDGFSLSLRRHRSPFLAQYVLRLRREPSRSNGWSPAPRSSIFSPSLPVPLALLFGADGEIARLFGVLWALKLIRINPAFALLGARAPQRAAAAHERDDGVRRRRALRGDRWLSSSEREAQPEAFGSVPAALWWAVTTITTTGYGDKIPVSFAGRVLAGVVMVSGIGLFALWAGILASGFSQELRRREFLESWDLVVRLPLFRNLGAAGARGDRAPPESAELRRRRVDRAPGSAGRQHVLHRRRRGGGAARRPARIRLGAGQFFGEMALITGEPRNATRRRGRRRRACCASTWSISASWRRASRNCCRSSRRRTPGANAPAPAERSEFGRAAQALHRSAQAVEFRTRRWKSTRACRAGCDFGISRSGCPTAFALRPSRHGKAHHVHPRHASDDRVVAYRPPRQRGRDRGDPRVDPRQAHARLRQEPDRGERPRLVRRRGAHRARPHRLPLGGIEAPHAGREPQARLLPLAGVPDRPAARRGAEQPRADRAVQRRARRSRRRSRPRCSPPSRTPRSAMAASAGSPPASWKAWRRSAIPAFGYGIRYDHGLFRQVIKDGEQQEYPENWLSFGNPWEFERPEIDLRRRLRRLRRDDDALRRRAARRLASGRDRAGGRLRHADRRLEGTPREPAPPLVGARRRSAPPRRLQRRRPCRRADRAGARRDDLEDPLSERRDAGRPGAAAAAGILLRLRLAAGSRRAGISASTATSARCPTRRRSS